MRRLAATCLALIVSATLISCQYVAFPPTAPVSQPPAATAPGPGSNRGISAAADPMPVAEVRRTTIGWSAGPLGPLQAGPYYPQWVGASSIVVFDGDQPSKLVDLADPAVLALDGDKLPRRMFTVSPDGSKLAYGEINELVVWDRRTNEEKRWPLAVGRKPSKEDNPRLASVYLPANLLSWSPDGRYLIGYQYSTQLQESIYPGLWVLDWEEQAIFATDTALAPGHAYRYTSWSPDGEQVVVWELFWAVDEYSERQAILLDLPTRATRVVVPEVWGTVQKYYQWVDGSYTLAPSAMGYAAAMVAAYDPVNRVYLGIGKGRLETKTTEIHWLGTDQQVVERLDLLPSLAVAGVIPDNVMGMHVTPYRSPDGRYIYLDGRVLLERPRELDLYGLQGIIDMVTMSVRFVLTPEDRENTLYVMESPAQRWLQGRAVMDSMINGGLSLLDPETMEITTYPINQKIDYAYCTDRGVLFTTPLEVAWLGHDGQVTSLIKHDEPATFHEVVGMPVISPTRRYIAIPQRVGVDRTELAIIDLERLP